MANVKSLLKALVSSSAADAADILGTLDESTLKAARNTFNEAYSLAKAVHTANAELAAKVAEERKAELETMIAGIQATCTGLDLEIVTSLAQDAMNKKYGVEDEEVTKSKKWEQKRVDVVVDGTVYNIPVNGNCTNVVRDAIQAAKENGVSREDWIAANLAPAAE